MRKGMHILLAAVMMLQMVILPAVGYAEDPEQAAVIDLPVFADAMVQSSAKANANFGAMQKIYSVALQGELSREIFMKFDLSQIREMGFTIEKAELYMTYGGSNTAQHGNGYIVQRVTDPAGDTWTEGNANGAQTTTDTDITWNNSRTMAETAEEVFNSGEGRLITESNQPTVVDITSAVTAEESDDFLTLRLITNFVGNEKQTWGIMIYSKEDEVEPMSQPHLRLTLAADQQTVDNAIAVREDAAAIDLGDIENITENFVLPTTGAKGSNISWRSSNPDVLSVSADGALAEYHQPQEDTQITMTATVSKGEASITREILVTVRKDAIVSKNILVSADTYVHNGNGTKNFGGDVYAFSAAAAEVSREIYLRFDLSELKKNAYEVLKADLSLQIQKNGGQYNQSYVIYALPDTGWTEGSAIGVETGVATDLTWNNSRTMAEQSKEIFDGSTLRPAYGAPFYSDITQAVYDAVYSEADTLVLRIVTSFRDPNNKNTYGIHVFTKESDGPDTQKPQLILSLKKNQDKADVYTDAAALSLGNLDTVSADLSLPKTGDKGSDISWQSSNPDILEISEAEDEIKAVYKNPAEPTEVTLTATVSKGEESTQKIFTVQVVPSDLSETAMDLQAISIQYDENALKIDLPAEGVSGSTITWESNIPAVVDNTGNVKRPAFADQEVILTATAAKEGSENATREFNFTIPALGRLIADKDTGISITIDSQTSATPLGTATSVMTYDDNEMRKILLGFDLSEVPQTVKKATLYITRSDANVNYLNFYDMSKDGWDEATLCGNNYAEVMQNAKGAKTAEVRLGGSGANLKYAVDVTASVQKAMEEDDYLTLEATKFTGTVAGEVAGLSKYPTSIYTKEYEISDYREATDYRPYLVFEYTEDPDEAALISQLNQLTLPAIVTDTLILPQNTVSGLPVTWTSRAEDFITSAGVVTPQATEATVRLTAAVSQNGKTVTRDYFVTMENPQFSYVILDLFYRGEDGNLTDTPAALGSVDSVRVLRTKNTAGKLYFAVYKDQTLVDCKTVDIPEGSLGEYFTAQIDGITFPEEMEGYSIKAFLLSDDGKLTPLAEAK